MSLIGFGGFSGLQYTSFYYINSLVKDTYFEFLRYVLTDNSFIKGKTLHELKVSLNPILENKLTLIKIFKVTIKIEI